MKCDNNNLVGSRDIQYEDTYNKYSTLYVGTASGTLAGF